MGYEIYQVMTESYNLGGYNPEVLTVSLASPRYTMLRLNLTSV